MVRHRDGARLGTDVDEAQRGAPQCKGVLEVAPPVFQAGAGGIDHGEHRDVADGLEHLLAVAQHVLGLGQAAEPKERAVAVESGTGGRVGAGAAPPLDVRDRVIEVECLLQPPEGRRGEKASADDPFPDIPWIDGAASPRWSPPRTDTPRPPPA